MQRFLIDHLPGVKLVVVRVTDERPKRSPGKDGLVTAYSVDLLNDDQVRGAHETIAALDEVFADRRRAPGVYQAPLAEVTEAFGTIVAAAPKPSKRHPAVRWGALAIAGLLTVGMAVLLPAAVALWLVICAFKRQSGLLTMAETAVVWSILDWRPIIKRLINVYHS